MTFPPMEVSHFIYFLSGVAVGGVLAGIAAYMAERS